MTDSEPAPPDVNRSEPDPPGLDPEAPIDPSAVVALVQEIVRDPWPTSEAAREYLFDRLNLTVAAWREAQNPHIVGTEQHFLTDPPIAGPVLCTWVQDDSTFVQIYLQLRFDAAPPSPETTACFDEIRRQFTELYGEPEIPWHGQRGLRRMWDANGLELDVHYGNDARSSLMVSISDGVLAALTAQEETPT